MRRGRRPGGGASNCRGAAPFSLPRSLAGRAVGAPPERPDAAGSPEQVGRALAEYVRRGATHLIVIPARGSDADAVMQLGGPVRARLQEAL